MELYRSILPSGRAVRFRRLETKDKLAIDDRVEKRTQGKGSSSQTMTETILTCLHSYTEPQTAVWCDVPVMLPNGKPALDEDDQPVTRKVFDVDKMLDAVPDRSWHLTSYEELSTKGPTSLIEVFNEVPDFSALIGLISRVSGKGSEQVGHLAGKVQQTSAA